ncbi:BON domain-containing protein [Bordetella sputigena]|uniref:BON domain-containing protein n=1 Tax=Bordetella sputigena TaxID=1416810 RepID=UPI0039EDE957
MKNHTLDCLVAAALGAATMYYFDPELGRRRRALLRDQFDSRTADMQRFLRRRTQWTADHMRGMAARAQHALDTAEAPASDRKVHERIRAAIGRILSTPGAVDVNVAAGNVLLTGHVLASQRDALVSAVSAVEGVERVMDQLSQYGEPGNVPELQGARKD